MKIIILVIAQRIFSSETFKTSNDLRAKKGERERKRDETIQKTIYSFHLFLFFLLLFHSFILPYLSIDCLTTSSKPDQ